MRAAVGGMGSVAVTQLWLDPTRAVLSLSLTSFSLCGPSLYEKRQCRMTVRLSSRLFTQEEGLIPGFVGIICGIPANIIGAIVIPKIGVWPAIFAGNAASIVTGLGATRRGRFGHLRTPRVCFGMENHS